MNKYGGVLLICKDTEKFMLLRRSKKSTYPKTWTIVSGGIEKGEDVLDGIKRELKEDTNIDSKDIKFEFFEHQNQLIPYFDFYIGYCNKEYECKLDHENMDWGWFSMDNLPKPLFPSLYSSLVRIF